MLSRAASEHASERLGLAAGDTTTVANHIVYDAFGNVTSETNPAIESLFLFTARPLDADTALQNNLNRWYDPRVGRWLSADPIGFGAGDPNLYRYVGNGPLLAIDPTGLYSTLMGCFEESGCTGVLHRNGSDQESTTRQIPDEFQSEDHRKVTSTMGWDCCQGGW